MQDLRKAAAAEDTEMGEASSPSAVETAGKGTHEVGVENTEESMNLD